MSLETFEEYHKLSIPAEEAYKVLRTNIKFFEFEKRIKTLTVTSYSPGEGKTTTSINLAISLAKSGIKVLYVDADLRKPLMMKSLGSSDFKGLSNLLMGRAESSDVIKETKVEGFYFVSCGIKPLNPAELIGSRQFSEFLAEVGEQFDMVIFDTPPLGSVIDAAIIASQTDGTLLVIQPGRVKYRNAMSAKEQLEKAGARILGAVLNKVSKNDYKNYYSGYDYYGSEKKYVLDWYKKQKKD